MVRPMCSPKVMEEKVLKLKLAVVGRAIPNGDRWYGHVLRRDDNNVLIVVLDLEVARESEDKQSRPGRDRKKAV